MNRYLPISLAALQLTIVTIATWLVCETDALRGAAAPFFH